MRTARITLELSGETLDNLLLLATRLNRHPDALTIDLLYGAIEDSLARIGVRRQPSSNTEGTVH
ncbi:MAG: hypothetical protein ACOX5Z_01275 [Desulfobulbus sp.]|jgi:proline dehydrogenase